VSQQPCVAPTQSGLGISLEVLSTRTLTSTLEPSIAAITYHAPQSLSGPADCFALPVLLSKWQAVRVLQRGVLRQSDAARLPASPPSTNQACVPPPCQFFSLGVPVTLATPSSARTVGLWPS